MSEEERKNIAEKAFNEINNACKLIDKDFLGLPKDIQGLLIECYKLGYMKGLINIRDIWKENRS